MYCWVLSIIKASLMYFNTVTPSVAEAVSDATRCYYCDSSNSNLPNKWTPLLLLLLLFLDNKYLLPSSTRNESDSDLSHFRTHLPDLIGSWCAFLLSSPGEPVAFRRMDSCLTAKLPEVYWCLKSWGPEQCHFYCWPTCDCYALIKPKIFSVGAGLMKSRLRSIGKSRQF